MLGTPGPAGAGAQRVKTEAVAVAFIEREGLVASLVALGEHR